MKITVIGIIAFLFSICIKAEQPKQIVATSVPVKLLTAADTLQYSLGAYLGQYIAANGFSITNADLFIKGMNEAIANGQLLVDAKIVAAKIQEYQAQNLVVRNKLIEQKLFETIKAQSGIGVLPSGVCYSVVRVGKGARPQLTDSIQLNVKGFLPDNTLFEDTYAKNRPYNLTPLSLLAGLSEAVQIMPAGSIWKVYVPSALAFGEKGVAGTVPAYSAVVFEVELMEKK